MERNNKKNQKNYERPTVTVVSFMIEGGFTPSVDGFTPNYQTDNSPEQITGGNIYSNQDNPSGTPYF